VGAGAGESREERVSRERERTEKEGGTGLISFGPYQPPSPPPPITSELYRTEGKPRLSKAAETPMTQY
jgi:hypothetical protein